MKKSKFTARLLSVLLSVLMVAGMVPVASAQEVDAYWPNFRGSATNMAITNTETPHDLESTVLKWAVKLGTGWTAAPSVQTIVDNALVVMSGSNLYKLDLQTGATLQSAAMAAAPSWGYTPAIYADGLIICPLGGGKLQAFDAKTLEEEWLYTDDLGGQSNTPISYADGKVYTGFWNSETKDANIVCVSTADGSLVWKKTVAGGTYWAGGAIVGDAVIMGADDGTGGFSGDGHLYALNKGTGAVISDLTLTGCGDVRSSMGYSAEKGRVYFTTKNGYIGSAAVDASTGALSDLKVVEHGSAQSTSTPVLYGDKVYYCCGSGVVSGSNGAGNFVVADADTLEMLYSVPLLGYPQACVLLSTAYYATEGKLYFYSTYNGMPGGLTLIKVDPTKDTADGAEKIEIFDAKGYENYCITSPICGPDGTIYYKNDSGYVMAVSRNDAYLTGMSGSVGSLKGEFSGSNAQMEWVVPIGTKEVTLTPEAAQGCSVTINGSAVSSAPITLTDGKAQVEVKVTKGTDTRTYTVAVREVSDDTTLSGLKVNQSNAYSSSGLTMTPAFAEGTYYYGVYEATRNWLNVWPDTTDANATVKVYPLENVDVTRYASDEYYQQTGAIDVTATNSGHDRYAIYAADETKPMAVRVVVTAENGDVGRYVVVMSQAAAAGEGAQLLAQIKAADEADQMAAAAVEEKIDAIGTVTPQSETAIAQARSAYDALTAEQKALVGNYSVLTDAEAALSQLQQAAAADKAAAAAVEKKIDAIGTVTKDSKAAIEAARAAYNALTDGQKALVSNYKTLTDAEAAYAKLADATPGDNAQQGPSTGDSMNMGLLVTIMGLSLCALIVLAVVKKKRV